MARIRQDHDKTSSYVKRVKLVVKRRQLEVMIVVINPAKDLKIKPQIRNKKIPNMGIFRRFSNKNQPTINKQSITET